MPAPRPLQFAAVTDALSEVRRLRDGGYRSLGAWDLRQCLDHLSDWIDYELDGYPPTPAPLRPVFWVVRRTFGPGILKKWLAAGAMPAGGRTDPRTVHAPDPDPDPAAEAAAADRFEAAVARFVAHDGEYVPSPLFGHVSREDAHALHAIHCAHHLGFLEPAEHTPGDSGPTAGFRSARPADD